MKRVPKVIRKGGRFYWASLVGTPKLDANGNPKKDKHGKVRLHKAIKPRRKPLTTAQKQARRRRSLLAKKISTFGPLDPLIAEQFQKGRLFACIASRPGQVGVADGYILEGPELHFYLKKMQKKKGAK